MLAERLLLSLQEQILCRETQIRQLAGLLDPDIPTAPTIVVHGTRATGKSITLSKILNVLDVRHIIIRSRECITDRHLLERTVLACKQEVEKDSTVAFKDIDGRCESLSILAVLLQRLLEHTQKFIIVFDGVDKQRESPVTLLPALARLGELIPSLTVLLTVTYLRPGLLSTPGIPYIHFPPYSRTDALSIVGLNPPDIFSQEQIASMNPQRRQDTTEDNPWLWGRFTGAVWDSLGKTAARDVVTLRSTCEKLWLPFVSHIRDGTYGTRDFSRLMVRTRSLFQSEDVLTGSLLAPARPTTTTTTTSTLPTPTPTSLPSRPRHNALTTDLPYYTRYLLLAAYLASHNPARTDPTFFSKALESKKRKRKNKKSRSGTTASTAQKSRKLSRRLLGPQPFGLGRWLAIFHAIVPDGAPGGSADVLTQVASLGALRMVVRSSTGGPGDAVGEGGRWRVNVGEEFVNQVARGLRFEVGEFLAE